MKTDDFDFDLPEEYIAQSPLKDRSSSKLLVMDRYNGEVEHHNFYEIINYLNPGDVLVVNDSKVIPARLFGHREGKEEAIEIFLLKEKDRNTWECLVKPGKKMKIGTTVILSDRLRGEVTDIMEDGTRLIKFSYEGIFLEILEEIGNMPLPPYIHEKLEDKNRYQTVYAKFDGSVAAPTAGLHFTKELLQKIKEKGVKVTSLTLHVGLGTFRPVSVEDVTNHHMHSEFYQISREACDVINEAHQNGHKVIAVGTTSMRTLESVAKKHGKLVPDADWTDIFIYPGFEFKVCDSLITNFHLPKSTLMMLVSAFSSREMIMHAYHEAIEQNYRFFSFGDAMFINGGNDVRI